MATSSELTTRAGVLGGDDADSKSSKAMRYRIHLSHEIFTDGPTNVKAAEVYNRAILWREANPASWRGWCAEVARAVESGALWSVRELAERSRRGAGHVNAAGGDFEVNNSLLPALARMLCEAVPGAVRFTELRNSVFEAAASGRRHG